jgi:hypothetical protein
MEDHRDHETGEGYYSIGRQAAALATEDAFWQVFPLAFFRYPRHGCNISVTVKYGLMGATP